MSRYPARIPPPAPDYIILARHYLDCSGGDMEKAAYLANSTYNDFLDKNGWSQDAEKYRNAEHYMFARYFGHDQPVIGQLSVFVMTPIYSAVKVFVPQRTDLNGFVEISTTPSLAEIGAGWMGSN